MNSKSNPMPETQTSFVRAGSLAQLPEGKSMTANLDGHVIAIFHTAEGIFAVDNRCPHMGFPLDRGTVKDCILPATGITRASISIAAARSISGRTTCARSRQKSRTATYL